MRPSTSIAEHGNQVREILNRAGMRNPKVFGSVARGEDTDLDILVEAPPGTSLYDLARVEIQLEELLGCRVEVLTKGFMAPEMRLVLATQALRDARLSTVWHSARCSPPAWAFRVATFHFRHGQLELLAHCSWLRSAHLAQRASGLRT
ncbi:putative nucleotidyltransferase [Bradyrhizobium sp. LB8.2]|nr:nucleotidyltransferase family protein [Bradyrhizobium sp. 197]MCK1478827.1 nucleotidyltransferase family protein [Bradyrhizobium sp. 197]